eukprot:gb/GECG01013027.1/.p1 GENE.gb/GECG01013027.1/~~gb/GECG01013027.1/.p1  ORF type:complete len:536 (+),score=58.74 gb/GECG01013027.1/:1-1608(+)
MRRVVAGLAPLKRGLWGRPGYRWRTITTLPLYAATSEQNEAIHTSRGTKDVSLPHRVISGHDISFLESPEEFHSTLLHLARNAKREIVLVSLYIGNASKEQEFIDSVKEALSQNSELRLRMLFDYGRGKRTAHGSDKSSFSLCRELQREFGQRVQASFFSVPWQHNFPWKYLRSKFQETVGVQHMKFYAFDDVAMISGANLSRDYFSNRQDRYVVVQNAKELIDDVRQISSVIEEYSIPVTSTNPPDIFSRPNSSESLWSRLEQTFLKLGDRGDFSVSASGENVIASVLVQFGQVGFNLDIDATRRILHVATEASKAGAQPTLHLATGYFNLHPKYEDLLIELASSGAYVNILTAAPEANGFHTATGLASSIPQAYTEYERDFLTRVDARGLNDRIALYEYKKPQWTFHAKGLWLHIDPSKLRQSELLSKTHHSVFDMMEREGGVLELVGSSNFGIRSVERDLELQLLLYSKNTYSVFGQQFFEEIRRLWSTGDKTIKQVDLNALSVEDRSLNEFFSWSQGSWIRIGKSLLKSFF